MQWTIYKGKVYDITSFVGTYLFTVLRPLLSVCVMKLGTRRAARTQACGVHGIHLRLARVTKRGLDQD
jgi:hypothetical protein